MARRPRLLPALAGSAVATTVLGAGCASAGNSGLAAPARQPQAAWQHLPSAPGSAKVKLTETGSTLLFPLMQAWASAYHQHYGQVTISTAGTGSGAGIQDGADGTANIGASDAFLSSGDLVDNPNSGMIADCRAHPGCVAYVGIAYLDDATIAGLGEAELSNAAGRYLLSRRLAEYR